MKPEQAELIKKEINRLTLELNNFRPQNHHQPLELIEAYGALVEISKAGKENA